MSELLQDVVNAWGWIGILPAEIIGENEFGNLLIKDVGGSLWRLCPEVPSCRVIAQNENDFKLLLKDDAFLMSWYLTTEVCEARKKLGAIRCEAKYGLLVPVAHGGTYSPENYVITLVNELVRASGEVAKSLQLKQSAN